MRLDFKNQKPLSSEELSQKDVQYAVDQTKLQLSSDILATERAIAERKDKLEVIKTTYPLDTKAYVETSSELEGYQDGLKRLKKLQEELGL